MTDDDSDRPDGADRVTLSDGTVVEMDLSETDLVDRGLTESELQALASKTDAGSTGEGNAPTGTGAGSTDEGNAPTGAGAGSTDEDGVAPDDTNGGEVTGVDRLVVGAGVLLLLGASFLLAVRTFATPYLVWAALGYGLVAATLLWRVSAR